MYDRVLLNELPCALVLENDAKLASAFAQRLHALSVPWEEVDLLKLGSCEIAPANHGAHATATPHDWVRRPLRLVAGSGGWCTSGYIITQRAARIVRDVQTPVWTVADGALRLWDNSTRAAVRMRSGASPPALRVRHTLPFVVTQNEQLHRRSELGAHWDGWSG